MARFFCSMAFANAMGSLPCISVVVQPTKHVSLPKAGFEIVATIQAGSSPPTFLMVRHAR
jgi:hypothetical protein